MFFVPTSRKNRKEQGESGADRSIRKKRFAFAALSMVLAGAGLVQTPAATAAAPAGSVFARVGNESGIDPDLLLAIALTESGARTGTAGVSPTEFAFRTPDGPVFPASRAEAESMLERILARTDMVDIGLMQVNFHWHKGQVSSPWELLDAEKNVRVAAGILQQTLSDSSGDAIAAIGHYHSRDPERALRYARHVWLIYRNLKALPKKPAQGGTAK